MHNKVWHALCWLVCLGGLGACASQSGPVPTPDTLEQLKGKATPTPEKTAIKSDAETARSAYETYLQKSQDDSRAIDAMRRLGDLELKRADDVASDSGQGVKGGDEAQVAREAAKHYEEKLGHTASDASDNDQVLYQLAHAREIAGDPEGAAAALDRLVTLFPKSGFADESQFRRGELLFMLGHYRQAEKAYEQVVYSPRHTPYFERSLYMMGWSRYKLANYDEALEAFLGVLDLKLIARDETVSLDEIKGVTPADRELIEDTLRVSSLCFANLQGVNSIAEHVQSVLRRDYEFRLYQSLAHLYSEQHRIKDAADTFEAFVHHYPTHPESPQILKQVIDMYLAAGFDTPSFEAKRQYVDTYGVGSEFALQHANLWATSVKANASHYLFDLATQDHALAQQAASHAQRLKAIAEYEQWLKQYTPDSAAAHANFLLAELLFDDGQFAAAASEYEKSAYQYPVHDKSADSGYGAILAYDALESSVSPDARGSLHQAARESAVRFADTFAQDARIPDVLIHASRTAFDDKNYLVATDLAKRVLQLPDDAKSERHLFAWRVLAHSAFAQAAYAEADAGYAKVLDLEGAQDPERSDITEKRAAAIYKLGEQARDAGDLATAVTQFARIQAVTPRSRIVPIAQFDIATSQIALKQWKQAALTLEDFRQRFADHPLAAQVGEKLTFAYVQDAQWPEAARESEALASSSDEALARDALWHAAEYAEKANNGHDAARLYRSYLQRFGKSLDFNIEARQHLIDLASQAHNLKAVRAEQAEMVAVEAAGNGARTARTRLLAGNASLALAEPLVAAYQKVKLVEPLKRQLKRKKASLEAALAAYRTASDYGVAEVTTQATYRTADLYRDFAKAMLASERPKHLHKDELEQYDVMLEEQAFPFEEKAGELFLANAHHTLDGVYDEWVRNSYTALALWKPARFERVEAQEDRMRFPAVEGGRADLPWDQARLEQAVALHADNAALWNQLGVVLRQAGLFAKAKEAYLRAMATDPHAASPVLNLGILNELYLWDDAAALTLYHQYQSMLKEPDPKVVKWIADIRNRGRAKTEAPSVPDQEGKQP